MKPNMEVVKRDGRREPVSFDKIQQRLKRLASGVYKDGVVFSHPLEIDVTFLSQQVIMQIRDGITTIELDEFAAETCAMMVMDHPDYGDLAGRIVISNHHKNTRRSFVDTMKDLYQNKDAQGRSAPLISNKTYKVISDHQSYFDKLVDYKRDYLINYFGFKTLERSYLLKSQSGHLVVRERPQYMYLRVAIGMHEDDLEAIKETYDLLSFQKLSHASPTLFNSGTTHPQLSSCFLLGMDDSLDGIYTALKKCAMISKHAGGIGIWVSEVRAKDSKIKGTNGQSDGLIPMLRVFNETARYVNQGGKRKGSIAIYLEPHHADIEDFLDLKKTHGDQSRRALDLFLALWVSDLFMKRLEQAIKNNYDTSVKWSLFCPDEAPGLTDVYGDEYEKLYTQYEAQGIYRKQVPIVDLWRKITDSMEETGVPYIGYKDCVNYRNPQMNIGVIKSSNLCIEITLVNDPKDETISVCNLAAVPLGSFITNEPDKPKSFDFDDLANSVRVAIKNLNRVIDVNFYPVEDCAKSNFRDRPVGLGVIGLYDAFCKLRYPFDSPEANKLNAQIFECIYYHALKTSMELAKKDGPYETFAGSPASQGKLQFDLWNEDRARFGHPPTEHSKELNYDWEQLRADIKQHGLRNSTLIALMPTASSAQIIGQNESFECMTYNVYVRRVLSGDFKLVNRYLQKDLHQRGLWTEEMQNKLIAHRGSVQNIPEIPDDLKLLYRTAFEIKQRAMLDHAVQRSAYIDMTSSQNIFVSSPNSNILTSIQMYAWKNRLKTGQYYLRRESTTKAVQFTVNPSKSKPTARVEAFPADNSKVNSYSGATGANSADNDSNTSAESADSEEGPVEAGLCLLSDPDCAACQV